MDYNCRVTYFINRTGDESIKTFGRSTGQYIILWLGTRNIEAFFLYYKFKRTELRKKKRFFFMNHKAYHDAIY